MTGRYYGDFELGETIEHDKRRTISEADNQRFCDMTMNQQPLHSDADFAEDTQFNERLVNGFYTMSLAVGLTIPDMTDGTIVANLSYDNVEHSNLVFHGDTIRVQSTLTDKRGVVTMHVEVFKVNDPDELLVCEFDRTVLSLIGIHAFDGTIFIYEGAPDYPEPDPLWEMIDRHEVTQFGISPTAIRALQKEGDHWDKSHDLSSLRLFGSTGEPLDFES